MKDATYVIIALILVIILIAVINSVSTTITVKIPKYDERHSVSDYRHGYTFRTTDEYKESQIKTNNNQFLDYTPYINPNLQKHKCYNYPPKDKLIYIKCR